MASTYTTYPATYRDDQMPDPHSVAAYGNSMQAQPTADANHLSPHRGLRSNSGSPSNTPAESVSTLSHYQSSDFSEHDDDPFFGVDFNTNEAGTPSFLEGSFIDLSQPTNSLADSLGQQTGRQAYTNNQAHNIANAGPYHDVGGSSGYPISPEVSNPTASPRNQRRGTDRLPDSISPQELQKPFTKSEPLRVNSFSSTQAQAELTPQSGRSSEDGLVPGPMNMQAQSPRVTVEYWDKHNPHSANTVQRSFFPDAEGISEMPGAPGDLISSTTDSCSANPGSGSAPAPAPAPAPSRRDEMGNWQPDPSTGQRGLDPNHRPKDEVESVNDMVTRREIEERNQEVDKWLDHNLDDIPAPTPPPKDDIVDNPNPADSSANDGIPLGDRTENKYVSGQTYYLENGGKLTPQDISIMQSNRNWADAPVLPGITKKETQRFQPESSHAAMAKFESMCHETDSIVSRAATWGTRRRSLPSIIGDVEGLSGNFLRKLTISREPRRPSGGLLNGMRTLVRKPSATIKRTLSNHDEEGFKSGEADKGNATPHLRPPQRTSSWNKKPSTPSINTALVSMGQSVAAVGAGQAHSRNGSISATSVTSPKSPFGGLTVRNIRRPRSKSDLPRPSTKNSLNGDSQHSNLVDLWKKTGGPPVANLSKGVAAADVDDDDDDEDEFEDSEMRVESSKMIEDITPTFAGFHSHILRLNPGLATKHTYLVDRIAHQQSIRYKSLLNAKVKHLQQGGSCPCGRLCVSLGGTATILDQKGVPRNLDPLSAKFDSSDGEMTPIEGAITQDSFPQDIPMPPTTMLPAEFECQLCYQPKKFQKPSDWTKHVHEDVQPFTCTWDKCRDAKIFKRKADWVRHENEGHRHLEWWRCDVEDCRHTCYRRDNFLQHLVREHKFPEPKVKTKAALKRAGGKDLTWQKVEDCHMETDRRPQQEPCRFCGKQFPTWKKLTVHLAKHMEQISLPVLRLVAAKELTPETIISPVQDPPPRAFNTMPMKAPPMMFARGNYGGDLSQAGMMGGGETMPAFQGNNQSSTYGFGVDPNMTSGFFDPQFDELSGLGTTAMGISSVNGVGHGYSQTQHMGNGMGNGMQAVHNMQPQVPTIPVTTATFGGQTNNHFMSMGPSVDAFPAMNAGLGLQQSQQQQQHTTMMNSQVGYDMIDSNGDAYTSQGSVSPYTHSLSHSPHQSTTNFYASQ